MFTKFSFYICDFDIIFNLNYCFLRNLENHKNANKKEKKMKRLHVLIRSVRYEIKRHLRFSQRFHKRGRMLLLQLI